MSRKDRKPSFDQHQKGLEFRKLHGVKQAQQKFPKACRSWNGVEVLCLSSFFVMAEAEESAANTEAITLSSMEMETAVGPVEVKYLGPEDGELYIGLPGMGGDMAQRMWPPMAEKLAAGANGKRILLPNP